MAIISRQESIPWRNVDDGSKPWTLFGSVDDTTNKVTYIAYGGAGGIMAQGTASKVIKEIQSVSSEDRFQTFIQDFTEAVLKMDAGFTRDYPPPPTTGVSTLDDFGNVDKLAGSEASELSTDFSGISQKFSDLGGSLSDPQVVGNALGEVVLPVAAKFQSLVESLIPPVEELIDGVKGQLSGLMGSVDSALKTLTGSGAGKLGVPNLNDVMGPITGTSPVMRAISLDPTNPDNIAALNATVAQATSFFSTAGIDLDTPAPLNLGSVMSFGTALHKYGADPNGFGTANMMNAMATNDAYGEALKVSIAEGKNNELLAEAGIPAPVTDAPTDYTKDREKLDKEETKLLAEYDNISSLKGKLDNVLKTAQKRTQILVLDTEFSNDPELVAIDNEVLQSLTSLAGTLQRMIDKG
jgi:hypothetical protein